ncbi:oligosaccharide flippase family protein [Desulfobacca acetoxidans]|uniref:Polysaccharide biosynthesis protein n=1 Tax=Desulfobacca acetoxidans (strain ATCC 700848 / DSM 11109 / ASRB2) TaxID=880072 RepID=F2NIJ9_DESAR|nr:polysaccharide biosynthesis protein [Desulfobacca acetoxidans DSM 11109]
MTSLYTKPHLSFNKLILSDFYRLFPGILSELLGGFILSTLLVKYLSPESMGIYTLLWIAQTQISALSTGWLLNSIIRFLPENPYYLRYFINISLSTIILLGFMCLVIIPITLILLRDYFQFNYLFWTALLLCLSSLYQLFQGILRGLFNQVIYSTNAFFLISIKLILLVILFQFFNNRLKITFIILALSHLPLIIWQYYNLIKLSYYNNINNISITKRTLINKSFNYGIPLSLSYFIILFLQSGDRYILSALLSLKDIGIYSFWMSIGLQISRSLYGFIFMIINPRLFQIYHTKPSKTNSYVRFMSLIYIFILGPFLLLISFCLPYFYEYIKADIQYTSHSHLLLFSIGMGFFSGLAQLLGKRFEFEKDTLIFVFASLVGVIVMVFGIFFLVPSFGLNGAGVSSLMGFVIYFLIIFFTSIIK